jgi:chemotaxis protein methyltransferase CheR
MVLIYFDLATRKKILGGIRGLLAQDGYLLLGASETTLNLDTDFTRKSFGSTVVYRRAGGR